MLQDAAKPVYSNITVADVLMPVDVRAQRALGIVGMNHPHIIQPQKPIGFGQHVAKSSLIGDIETACQ